jgi:hypothetical protein
LWVASNLVVHKVLNPLTLKISALKTWQFSRKSEIAISAFAKVWWIGDTNIVSYNFGAHYLMPFGHFGKREASLRGKILNGAKSILY